MNDKLDMWIMSNAKFFPAEKIPLLQEKIAQLPDSKVNLLYSVELKDPTTLLIVSILLGELGVDRFMLGDTGLGVLKLLTLGGCLVWWLIDCFTVQNRTRELNFMRIMQIIGQVNIRQQ